MSGLTKPARVAREPPDPGRLPRRLWRATLLRDILDELRDTAFLRGKEIDQRASGIDELADFLQRASLLVYFGRHQPTAPEDFSAAISASANPYSASTASVCWHGAGDGPAG